MDLYVCALYIERVWQFGLMLAGKRANRSFISILMKNAYSILEVSCITDLQVMNFCAVNSICCFLQFLLSSFYSQLLLLISYSANKFASEHVNIVQIKLDNASWASFIRFGLVIPNKIDRPRLGQFSCIGFKNSWIRILIHIDTNDIKYEQKF